MVLGVYYFCCSSLSQSQQSFFCLSYLHFQSGDVGWAAIQGAPAANLSEIGKCPLKCLYVYCACMKLRVLGRRLELSYGQPFCH